MLLKQRYTAERKMRLGTAAGASLAVLLLLGTAAAHAQNQWVGPNPDLNWNNPSNWTNGDPTGAPDDRRAERRPVRPTPHRGAAAEPDRHLQQRHCPDPGPQLADDRRYRRRSRQSTALHDPAAYERDRAQRRRRSDARRQHQRHR